jgi:hypothetical protein
MLKHQRKLIGIALLLLSVNLTGCASFLFPKAIKEISIFSKPVDKTPLNLELPPGITANRPVTWTIVTPATQNFVWEDLERKNERQALVCLSDKGYENLAITILELRNNAAQSRDIANKYKEYYEPSEGKE